MMGNCEDTCVYMFYETMSNLHMSLCESMWREFHLSLDFPCMEEIPIHAVMKLEDSFLFYIELIACEKTTYICKLMEG